VPWAVLGGERSAITRAKVDSLNISVTVGVDTLIKALRRVVTRVGLAIAVNPENFAA